MIVCLFVNNTSQPHRNTRTTKLNNVHQSKKFLKIIQFVALLKSIIRGGQSNAATTEWPPTPETYINYMYAAVQNNVYFL